MLMNSTCQSVIYADKTRMLIKDNRCKVEMINSCIFSCAVNRIYVNVLILNCDKTQAI